MVLQLLERSGDFVSDEIWHRAVQLVTNNPSMQEYAARNVAEALKRGAAHEVGWRAGELGGRCRRGYRYQLAWDACPSTRPGRTRERVNGLGRVAGMTSIPRRVVLARSMRRRKGLFYTLSSFKCQCCWLSRSRGLCLAARVRCNDRLGLSRPCPWHWPLHAPQSLVCTAAYVLGEYGRLIRAEVPPAEQYRLLHNAFPAASQPAKALLMTALLKVRGRGQGHAVPKRCGAVQRTRISPSILTGGGL